MRAFGAGLWIPRLVVWSEPGLVLRQICLRRGLNIIWVPDPADRADVSEQDPYPRTVLPQLAPTSLPVCP